MILEVICIVVSAQCLTLMRFHMIQVLISLTLCLHNISPRVFCVSKDKESLSIYLPTTTYFRIEFCAASRSKRPSKDIKIYGLDYFDTALHSGMGVKRISLIRTKRNCISSKIHAILVVSREHNWVKWVGEKANFWGNNEPIYIEPPDTRIVITSCHMVIRNFSV